MRRKLVWVSIAAAGLLAACIATGDDGGRFPTSGSFPSTMMNRTSFAAGGGHPWMLSALRTPDRASAPWKIVVVTGTPSWSEYWAPTLAKLPADREMIVADRPGFAMSEPKGAVTSIRQQAEALSAMLDGPPEQKVVLIGQSYGGPVSTLLAAMRPDKVKALVLMSAFYGEPGPTARALGGWGTAVSWVLPRDLGNALAELKGQKPQLAEARQELARLSIPIVVLHGDRDTFVEPPAALRLAAAIGPRATMRMVPGGDHFLNACCVDAVLAAAEEGIARAEKETIATSTASAGQ